MYFCTSRRRAGGIILFTCTLTLGGFSCVGPRPSTTQSGSAQSQHVEVRTNALTLAATQPTTMPGLHQLVAYGPTLLCGAVPEGDEGFASLAALGVKTIISVDGAQPDAERARKYGLRYVHLPIGYDGMDHERALEIARAVNDLPGPTYIHCHHGKHRSAGAAASTAVMLGFLDREAALARMKISGTAPAYPGLFKCATDAERVGSSDLKSVNTTFPEHAKTSGVVQAMVQIDETFDRLKAIEKAGWKTPTDHPDLVPAAEAGKLADSYRVLAADPELAGHPKEMVDWMNVEAANAAALEAGIVAAAPNAELSSQIKRVAQSCTDCHAKYRN
ncbi:MAG: hypothetical protein QM770_14140 [Tepidisphaeraceae bacterium]